MPENFCRFEHPPVAVQARGHPAHGWPGEERAAFLQSADVFAGGRVVIHPGIHRGGYQQPPGQRQRGNCQQVIGLAVGQFGEGVGGAGRNQEQIGLVTQPNVQDMRLAAPQVGVGEGFLPGNRLKGERGDKFFSASRQNDIDLRALLGQFRGQIGGFVGRD